MKLIKYPSTNSESLFGTLEAPISTNIKPIGHTEDASEYLALSFEATTPAGCTEITAVPENTFYFFHRPINGYWATTELVLSAAKELRDLELDKIIVTVDGIRLDGNEQAQERMSRFVVTVGEAGSTDYWKSADNEFVTVTGAQLKQAVLLAGQAQTDLWLKYSL